MSKYHAKRETVDGISFHSQREAREYRALKQFEKLGLIESLECQPKFPIVIAGVKVCTVIADFRYLDKQTGETRTIDVKGFRTPIFNLKKKLVKAVCGVEIEVVR